MVLDVFLCTPQYYTLLFLTTFLHSVITVFCHNSSDDLSPFEEIMTMVNNGTPFNNELSDSTSFVMKKVNLVNNKQRKGLFNLRTGLLHHDIPLLRRSH